MTKANDQPDLATICPELANVMAIFKEFDEAKYHVPPLGKFFSMAKKNMPAIAACIVKLYRENKELKDYIENDVVTVKGISLTEEGLAKAKEIIARSTMANDIDLAALAKTWPELMVTVDCPNGEKVYSLLIPSGKRFDTLVAHAVEVQEVLGEVEWIKHHNGLKYCPICGREECYGHSDNCRLSRLLGRRK